MDIKPIPINNNDMNARVKVSNHSVSALTAFFLELFREIFKNLLK
jgi:hypothetical protein